MATRAGGTKPGQAGAVELTEQELQSVEGGVKYGDIVVKKKASLDGKGSDVLTEE